MFRLSPRGPSTTLLFQHEAHISHQADSSSEMARASSGGQALWGRTSSLTEDCSSDALVDRRGLKGVVLHPGMIRLEILINAEQTYLYV